MSSYLKFNFSINDPKFKTTTLLVSDTPLNYISHVFIQTPIYDIFGVEIGYKVANDYVQQVNDNEYLITINSTYYIKNNGTISWQYSFINSKPTVYYPTGVLASSNITSTTGIYFGKTGAVSLIPNADGTRDVTVGFNF
jgi:hypothetical protein